MADKLSIVVWAKQGCSYCEEVKQYLRDQELDYLVVDVTTHDDYRDILEKKYNVRHVPVVEVGSNGTYVGVTEVGLQHLQKAIGEQLLFVADV